VSSLPKDVERAIARHGHQVDRVARRYGVDGQTLLRKLVMGESGGRKNAVSSAGARGWAQFMPDTRQSMIQKYGIDPWRSADEAIRAAVHHLNGDLGHANGLEGYNPGGGQSYVNYILGPGRRQGAQAPGARPARRRRRWRAASRRGRDGHDPGPLADRADPRQARWSRPTSSQK